MPSEVGWNTAPPLFQKFHFHKIKTIANAMCTAWAFQINWNYLTHFWLKSWSVLWKKQKYFCFIKCTSFKASKILALGISKTNLHSKMENLLTASSEFTLAASIVAPTKDKIFGMFWPRETITIAAVSRTPGGQK